MYRLLLLCGLLLATACTHTNDGKRGMASPESEVSVVKASDVSWEYLNPARGDKSPQAGTLWGDRKGKEPTGFLLKPVDGFESPPHIHNVSYRGVVIRGVIHNDDPDAEEMWMPSGSFWTQPKGGVHITAAKGTDTLAYIEIEEGPYLVLPVEEKFESGEWPVNVHESNIVWVGASELSWVPVGERASAGVGAATAYLWGALDGGELNGRLLRLPRGFDGKITTAGDICCAVVIQGQIQHATSTSTAAISLEPGSFIQSRGATVHAVKNLDRGDSVLYLRTNGPIQVSR